MSYYDERVQISALLGLTLTAVTVADDKEHVRFVADNGAEFLMYHSQDCCESVDVDDVCGDLADLIGSPVTLAEESTNEGGYSGSDPWPEGIPQPEYAPESYTWTFYRIGTAKGMVTIRWYGVSNGYYSESVTFFERKREPTP